MNYDYILTVVYQGQYRELTGDGLLVSYLVAEVLMTVEEATCLFVDASILGEAHRDWPIEVHVERTW